MVESRLMTEQRLLGNIMGSKQLMPGESEDSNIKHEEINFQNYIQDRAYNEVEQTNPSRENPAVSDERIGHYLDKVGRDTYPEQNLKPSQVPQWPEGTVHKHSPIELSLGKTYPTPGNNQLDSLE